MAQTLTIQLPPNWTTLSGGPVFDTTRTGRPGRWDINLNDPFAVWEFSVTYVRERAETTSGHTFDEVLAFFVATGSAYAFLVDDVLDNTDSSGQGSGVVEILNGVLRLAKHYTFAGTTYVHPITRPKAGIALAGGAAGGAVDLTTGVVTGAAAGTWTGGFYRPMIFLGSGLKYDLTPDGLVRNFTVSLQENLEI